MTHFLAEVNPSKRLPLTSPITKCSQATNLMKPSGFWDTPDPSEVPLGGRRPGVHCPRLCALLPDAAQWRGVAGDTAAPPGDGPGDDDQSVTRRSAADESGRLSGAGTEEIGSQGTPRRSKMS